MKAPRIPARTSLSLLLSLVMAIGFTLSSFAAARTGEESREPAPIADNLTNQGPTATITVKGYVTIGGIKATTGDTVLNGSLISTSTGAHASIEMGPLGRVALKEETTVTLKMMDSGTEVILNKCGSVTLTVAQGKTGTVTVYNERDVGVFSERREVDVRVLRGEALVKYETNKEKRLREGQHDEFEETRDVSANGDALYMVYCHEDHLLPLAFLPLAGLLFLTKEGDIPPPISPLEPTF